MIDELQRKKQQLEQKATDQIKEALDSMREELHRSNENAAKQVQPNEQARPPIEFKVKPLIYISYPPYDKPEWVEPFTAALSTAGYLVFNPRLKVSEQFNESDLPFLRHLTPNLVKGMCSVLHISENVLHPFDTVTGLLHKGDMGDNAGLIFQYLWFLTRSSLVVCDITRPLLGGTAQELLYSKLLRPSIAFIGQDGRIDPFVQNTVSLFFNDTNLLSIFPIIRGYVPL